MKTCAASCEACGFKDCYLERWDGYECQCGMVCFDKIKPECPYGYECLLSSGKEYRRGIERVL